MDLAARTTASPAEIWTICAVAVACLTFWLSMIWYADRHPYVRHRRLPVMPGSVLGGIHLAAGGRSVAPTRHSPAATGEDLLEDLAVATPGHPGQPGHAAEPPQTAGAPEPGTPVPAQRGPRSAAEPAPAARDTGTPPAGAAGGAGAGGTAADAPTEPIPAQRTESADSAPAETAGRPGADRRS